MSWPPLGQVAKWWIEFFFFLSNFHETWKKKLNTRSNLAGKLAVQPKSSPNLNSWSIKFFSILTLALTAADNWITGSSTVAHSWKMDVQHGYKSRLSSACWLTKKKSFHLWLDEVQGSAPFTCCFPCWGMATWTRHIFVRKKYTLESGIEVGQGITLGPGKFVKKNNVGPWINVGHEIYVTKNPSNLKISVSLGQNSKI